MGEMHSVFYHDVLEVVRKGGAGECAVRVMWRRRCCEWLGALARVGRNGQGVVLCCGARSTSCGRRCMARDWGVGRGGSALRGRGSTEVVTLDDIQRLLCHLIA